MAQLYYRYSTMNAGKSIEVIKVAYNYEERGKRVLALVPGIDDRYGKGRITSRVGLSREAVSYTHLGDKSDEIQDIHNIEMPCKGAGAFLFEDLRYKQHDTHRRDGDTGRSP